MASTGGRPHGPVPNSASLGGGAELSPGICAPPSASASVKSVPTCCVRRNSVLGLRPGGCREVLERRDRLHGKTHIHMQEHVSTQSVPWTHGTSSRVDRLPGSPAPAGAVGYGRRGLPRRPCFADLCHGRENMLPRAEGCGVGRGLVLTASQNHPVLSCGQGSLYMSTPLPGSPRGGGRREEAGEGMREYDPGVQIPAETL